MLPTAKDIKYSPQNRTKDILNVAQSGMTTKTGSTEIQMNAMIKGLTAYNYC